jgi:hypothetical protein
MAVDNVRIVKPTMPLLEATTCALGHLAARWIAVLPLVSGVSAMHQEMLRPAQKPGAA